MKHRNEYNKKELEELKRLCKDKGVNFKSAYERKRNHSEQTNEEIVESLLKYSNTETIKDKCNRLGINYKTVIATKHRHPELSHDEIIERTVNKKDADKTLIELFRDAGIEHEYNNAYAFKQNNKEYTDKEILELYINKGNNKQVKNPKYYRQKSFRQKCIDAGVEYNKVYCLMYNYRLKEGKQLSDEESIELYKKKLDEKEKSFLTKCKKHNVDITKARNYRYYHKNLTDEEIILHFRSELCINIFGEIIEI